MKVAVVSTGVANVASVLSVINKLEVKYVVAERRADLRKSTHMIIPGVGSFGRAMAHLTASGMASEVLDWSESEKPILGICLGMQILGASSEESPGVSGLGLLAFSSRKLPESGALSIPHSGWNTITPNQSHPVSKDLRLDRDFYFSHSFAAIDCPRTINIASGNHGVEFAAVVGQKSVLGVQFHPEISHRAGEKLISNFVRWDGQW